MNKDYGVEVTSAYESESLRHSDADKRLTYILEPTDGTEGRYHVDFDVYEREDEDDMYINSGHGMTGPGMQLHMAAALWVACQHARHEDHAVVRLNPYGSHFGDSFGREARWYVFRSSKRHIRAGRNERSLCGVKAGTISYQSPMDDPTEMNEIHNLCETCRKAFVNRQDEMEEFVQ